MKLLCIDGNSVLNRAFYGIKLLTTRDGRYTNAVYGFMNIFLKLIAELAPDAVAVAFDMRGGTFRNELYSGYKANRKGMPEELAQQLPVLQELLGYLGYSVVTAKGFEADDLLGTFSLEAKREGARCFIATGDRDSLQLVDDGTTVLLTTTKFGRGETEMIDPARVMELYGVEPIQLIEVKALMGDSSDNVPGVAGVGEKTALSLIQSFKDLDGVYENLADASIKPGVRDKLTRDKDMAYLSRRLVTIKRDVPVDASLENYRKTEGEPEKAAALLGELEMHSIVERLGLKVSAEAPAKEKRTEQPETVQVSDAAAGDIEGQSELFLLSTQDGFFAVSGMRVLRLGRDALRAVLSRKDARLCCFDSKGLYHTARALGADAPSFAFDLELAAYLLNPAASDYSIERLAAEYAVRPAFCCEALPEAGLAMPLCEKLGRLLDESGMTKLLCDIELPLARVLADMEEEGFLVDTKGIREFGAELEKAIETEKKEVFRIADGEFNLNSPKQLGHVLFEKLGIRAGKKTKSGFSTDAETLESLRADNPIVEHILSYRTYQKLQSTYVEGLLKAAGPDGRVHTVFKQTETRTGRISSTEPNLQNIPVRTDLGSRMRRFFEAGEGRVLLDADYSQIELRVLAAISDDKHMKAAFAEGEDIHTATASQIFKLPRTMVTPLLRRRAKAVNFGIVYGIGAFSLAKNTGVSVQEASKYIADYLDTYSGIRNYLEKTVEDAKNRGFVTTLFGRRRMLPDLQSSNKQVQALGKRLAMNTPIQGTAADIIKLAMIRVSERLKNEKLDAKLILQVHDELIVESSEQDAKKAAAALKEEMENAAMLSVALEVEVGEGKTWYDAK